MFWNKAGNLKYAMNECLYVLVFLFSNLSVKGDIIECNGNKNRCQLQTDYFPLGFFIVTFSTCHDSPILVILVTIARSPVVTRLWLLKQYFKLIWLLNRVVPVMWYDITILTRTRRSAWINIFNLSCTFGWFIISRLFSLFHQQFDY